MVGICKVVLYTYSSETNLCVRVGNIFVRYKVLLAFENAHILSIPSFRSQKTLTNHEIGKREIAFLIPVGFNNCKISSKPPPPLRLYKCKAFFLCAFIFLYVVCSHHPITFYIPLPSTISTFLLRIPGHT